ncbi:MAG: HK97 family phage prohead protease [Lachnospiraceae bacterium]|nr:HK97 family phage prohead protease [Lachnospiraceae bacterium]
MDRNIKQTRSLEMKASKLKTREESNELIIEGYFAVFGSVYNMGYGMFEEIAPGAFARTIQEDDIRALTNHDTTLVLGRNGKAGTLELKEDEIGLWARIRINPNDSDATNTHARVQRGDVSQCSIGFEILNEDTEFIGDTVKWTIREVKLWEVSVCTFPAYEETGVSARRKDFEDMKERRSQAWKEKMLKRLKGEKEC